MFNKIHGLILSLAVGIFLASGFAVLSADKKISSAEKNIANTTYQTETEYLLKDYNGYLAAFYKGSEKPYIEFDVRTDSFSEYDRILLKKGIKAVGEEEIRKLIEDYTE